MDVKRSHHASRLGVVTVLGISKSVQAVLLPVAATPSRSIVRRFWLAE
jgi:hypothetical protein